MAIIAMIVPAEEPIQAAPASRFLKSESAAPGSAWVGSRPPSHWQPDRVGVLRTAPQPGPRVENRKRVAQCSVAWRSA